MSGPLSVSARLSKLRAMSFGEVAHRLGYRASLAIERRQHGHGDLALPTRLQDALVPSLRGTGWAAHLLASRRKHRARFLPGVSDIGAMRLLFATRYSAERLDTLARSEQAASHTFAFFGQTFKYGDEIPWQHDPVSGRAWPSVFHADVPVHGGNVGYGDVKHVWELSRQQYLIDLGKAYYLTGARPALDSVQRLVRSWIAGNPYATGVNWACALEPAFRSFSWLWAYYLTVDGLDDAFHLEWLTGVYDHARFIARHLEHYSSPFNHLIGEAAALYLIASCFPEFKDADRWRASARAVLERRLAEQFYADGGSVEQSTFYHHATVGYLLLALLMSRAIGEELAPAITAAIERGLEFSLALAQPDGRTPEIGGADDGKPIRMEHLPFWDFRPYLAIGAVLFRRADFKAAAGRFHEDALWLLGPAGVDAFDALESRLPDMTSFTLPGSGYDVFRSDWSADGDYVCFDCGEQAAGMRTDGIPNSMHGHADCLSVIAWLGGKRLLVDSGFHAYNAGGAWEAHFRETAAHNTARIDGRDQALHIGKMAWSYSYRATHEGIAIESCGGWAIGSHDGYARGPRGVTHRRGLWLRDTHYLVIVDEFVGHGEHDLEVNFQFAPGDLALDEAASLATFDGYADLAWAGSSPWRAEVRVGGSGPDEGWIAPSLGVACEAPRLTLRCRTSAPRSHLLSIVATRPEGFSRIARVSADGAGELLAVGAGDATDWITTSLLGVGTAIHTDAIAAVCRRTDAGVTSGVLGHGAVAVDAAAIARLASNAIRKDAR